MTPAAGAAATPNPFGAVPTAAAATPNPFGAAPAAAAATPATGLFGGAAAQSPFGVTPAAAPPPLTGGGGLGLGLAAPATTPGAAPFGLGGGLFGGAPAPVPALGGGLFGGAAPAAGGLFGAAAPAPAPAGLAAPGAAAPPEGSQDSEIFAQWQQQMLKAWDDKDYKQCSFKYVFFEDLSHSGTDGMMAPPPAAELLRKRAESLAASDTGMWERADAQNPDPSRFLPVQVTGFNALHERRTNQLKAARDLADKLKESQEVISKVEDERVVGIDLRFRHYVERQQMLQHRVLRLYAAIERQHLLRCHGGVEPPLTTAERSYIQKLQELAQEMERPGCLSRLYELSTRLQQEAEVAGQLEGLPPASRIHLDNLQEWLSRQQEAVRTLINVSQQDLKDLGIAADIAKGG